MTGRAEVEGRNGTDGFGDLRHHIILTLHVPYRTATVCRSHAPIFRLWLGTVGCSQNSCLVLFTLNYRAIIIIYHWDFHPILWYKHKSLVQLQHQIQVSQTPLILP